VSETEALTVSILREIRDEIRATRQDLGARIDQTNARLEHTNLRMDKVEETLLELAEQQRFVVRYIKTLAERDRRFDTELAELRGRVDSIEKRIGSPPG